MAAYSGASAPCFTEVASSGTDALGNYALVVPDGTFKVQAVGPTGSTLAATWFGGVSTFGTASNIVVSGADNTGKNITLPTGHVISGTVAKNGVAVASADVSAFDVSDQNCAVGVTTTDTAGAYTMLVPDGSYKIRALFPGAPVTYFPSAVTFASGTTVSTVGSNAIGKTFTFFTISGTITDTAGAPIAGASVVA